MKKSEAKSQQSADATLEAPVRLTPEQLEIVAAGFAKQILVVKDPIGGTILTGAISPRLPTLPTKTFQF
ncbi:hypothetical protein [Bradyrhizobium sp. AUGA SZCCT0431]|uniref:hypothetical protein n=1 Tax=Bradyrhizobium sp. AUGA SZCCT0431 TaxID=2807674 RepID=UPI001BA4BFDD|nr:hypothetical protein [Bradyrhizobium sp. AUGA SZCCT0431]MBR1145290.1 hypothetical protein [Bradyrhizobium sp. AUGA SZCCT0431]